MADDQAIVRKLHLLTSIPARNIMVLENVDTVYRVPLVLEQQRGAQQIADWLGSTQKPDLRSWRRIVRLATKNHDVTLKIGMVAKYLDNLDTYKSVTEAMRTAAWDIGVNLQLSWVDSESLEAMSPSQVVSKLMTFDGILIPGGFGKRGIEGMIAAATYAFQHNMPYFGICLGMQVLTIAFARQHGWTQANSKEFEPEGSQLVITYLEGQQQLQNTGGTMRLGSYQCALQPDSLAQRLYGQDLISERHRHRFEFNPEYTAGLEAAGLRISGICPQNDLVEIVEIPACQHVLGCQFHPEFSSRPMRPQALFVGFLKAAKKRHLQITRN